MATSNPNQYDSERGLALQKYLLLHSQHNALQKHLSQITPSMPTTTSPFGTQHASHQQSMSISTSPSDDGYLSSSPPTHSRFHQRTGSTDMSPSRPKIVKRRFSLPDIMEQSIVDEVALEELKLKNVNQQIKGTLTELLNCQSVRKDDRYRKWVQTRLMDAERELKGTRSRSGDQRRMSVELGMF
ncbi:hypothetical protein B0O99DRAFT_613462 [Bisporella sp. PMI_857]|nr:hypothetical protein B0O99DRAFT_613462 [Bisporella sp. PMI_857]